MKPRILLNLGILLLLIALLVLAADGVTSLLQQSLRLRSLGELLGLYGLGEPPQPAGGAAQWLRQQPAALLPLVLGAGLMLLDALRLLVSKRRRGMLRWGRRGAAPTAAPDLGEAPPAAMPAPAQPAADPAPSASPATVVVPAGAATASAPIAARAPAKPAAPPEAAIGDREFLPAALEIFLTPPSPVAMALIVLISAAVLSGLAWSYFGWIDIYAVASGRIQLSGRSKIIQPFESGKIVNIKVENGQHVAAGEVLLELDATESGADRQATARELESATAEAARRRTAIAAASDSALSAAAIPFPAEVGDTIRQREERVMAADLAQLGSTIDNLNAQIAEKNATKARLQASIDARSRLIDLARERVGMRTELEQRGAGSRALIIEAQQQLESYLTTDASEQGQLAETDAGKASLESRSKLALTQFIAEQTQKLAEIEQKRDRLEQELIKSRSKNERTLLKSPIDGTVQQLNVTTIGQVVTTGQSLLTVVPSNEQLQIEAMISNKDIGFVKAGQHAVVKVEAFPFTRFGTLDAEVLRVSRDAVDDREAAAMADAAKLDSGRGTPKEDAAQPQRLVFPATLRLERSSLVIDGQEIPLVSGMAVTVEVKTGARRAIDYVLSPLREMASGAGHER